MVGQDIAASIGAWFIALTLIWSGTTKVRAPQHAAAAISNFGLAKQPSVAGGIALGLVEFVVGLGLAMAVAPAAFLTGATLLCVAFVIVIGRSLARGDRFICACFGESTEPLSYATLGRAVGLAALSGATLALTVAGAAVQAGMHERLLSALSGAAALGIIVQLWLVQRLWRLDQQFRRE